MYNEEIKLMFVEYINSKAKLPFRCIENLFEKTEGFENEYSKDCCNWTTKEIIEFYKFLNTRSVEVLVVTNSRLRQYTQWCINKNMVNDFQNHYTEINNSLLITCVNTNVMEKEIITYDELNEYLFSLDNPSDKFLLLGLFEGLSGKDYSDFYDAKTTDIIKDELGNGGYVFKTSTKFIPISSKLADYGYESANEYLYYVLTETGRTIQLMGGEDRILKDKVMSKDINELDDFMKGRRIYTNIKRFLASLGLSKRITPKAIYNSGMIYYLNVYAKENNMTVVEFLSDKNARKGFELKYKPVHNVSKFMLKYGKYLE